MLDGIAQAFLPMFGEGLDRDECKAADAAGHALLRYLPALDLPDGRRVAVGWSGGADSTALLLALRAAGHSVMAWHVDHGWHAQSAEQAEALAALAARWGVPWVQGRVAVAASRNREAEARRARWEFFVEWGRALGIRDLFLAHQADEQAETVCMRMLQGAGVGGCRGMLGRRSFGPLVVHRPWLGVRKADLLRVLRSHGIPWFEDPSNRDLALWRNRLRFQMFPAICRAGRDPVELFLRWARQADDVYRRLDEQAELLVPVYHGHAVCIDWDRWRATQPAVRAVVLQRMVRMLLGDGVTPGRRHIELVERWTFAGGRGGLDLSRCRLHRRNRCLHLAAADAMLC